MTSWQYVWRKGVEPGLSDAALFALRAGLTNNDRGIIQGATTSPPPLECVRDWPVEGACMIGFCGWFGEGLETVAEVEAFFCGVCVETDLRLDEPAACRWLLNWFDDTPRLEMIRELLAEVNLAIERRSEPKHALAS